MNLIKISLFTVVLFISNVKCWDNDDLEIFDLVEEIKDNFYDILKVPKDAQLNEIKRAFRTLSVILHPDKNDAEDANIVFRNLVSVYEVLKDSGKREKYDKVLRDGLPNWKSGVYYYRHFRKMGLIEMSIILFIIITIGQYFISWAAYIEKRYTTEQLIGSKIKKFQKKNKTNVAMDEILKEIPTPSIKNTLPFQIPRTIWNLPKTIKNLYNLFKELRDEELERKRVEKEKLELQKKSEEEFLKEKESKAANRKKKPGFIAPEKTEEELMQYSARIQKSDDSNNINSNNPKPIISGGIWTDEDLMELARLIKKYPGGTTDRWEIIADSLFRNVAEVTHMAHKLKENGYRIGSQTDSVAETLAQNAQQKIKEKTKKTEQILVPESTWTQEQQQALEGAIVKYPKSNSGDRWQKIANTVPGKTKEECLLRYKYLVELVKMQKQKQEKENLENKDEDIPTTTTTTATPIDQNKTDDDKLEDEEKFEQKINKTKKQNKKSNTKTEKENQSDGNNEENVEDDEIKTKTVIKGGKKKNLRKEKKRRGDFSDDEDEPIEDL